LTQSVPSYEHWAQTYAPLLKRKPHDIVLRVTHTNCPIRHRSSQPSS